MVCAMKRKIFSFLAFSLIVAVLSVKEALAKTIIDTTAVPCEIHIILNKEFYSRKSVSIVRWINALNDRIAQLQERLNNAATDAERDQARKDLNYFTSQRQSLTDIIMFNAPLTTDELRALAAGWKAQIGNKWNLPNYRYDCCKVVVEVNVSVREEEGSPTPGFDQIGIVSGDFRSFIRGLRNFDTSGFSGSPYRDDLSGIWSSNMIEGYTAPHEAGHEMGLDDRYEDPVEGGPSRPLPGHENDLLGGNGTHEQLRNLKIVVTSPTGEVLVDNLRTILHGRLVHCETQCCGPTRIPGGARPETRQLTMDASGRHPEDGETASVSTEPAAKTTGAQRAGPSSEHAKPSEQTRPQTPDSSIPATTETIQYKQVKVNDVTSDTGVLIKDTPTGSRVDISSLPTGKGANFRKWEVDKIALDFDGERVRPVKCDNFYVVKESALKGPATAVFVALGSQYKGYADKAGSGEVCPITGEKKAGSDVEENKLSEGINRAGIAAGLGLIVSQARGQITGKKCAFELNKEQSQKLKDKKGKAKINLINEDDNLQETIDLPLK